MEQAVIELAHLVKKFGDLVAVNDVTLTIPRGEFFAMLGPNAAGKTTTLKILAGLMKPTSGSARVFNENGGRNTVGTFNSLHKAEKGLPWANPLVSTLEKFIPVLCASSTASLYL